MRLVNITYCTCLLLSFSNLFYANAIEHAKLVVCSEPAQIPYEMINKNGQWIGFDVDMVTAFSNYIATPYEMRDTKWDGIIPALQTAKCDMIASSMAKTSEREKVVSFSDTILEDGVLAASLLKNKNIHIQTNSIQDYDKEGILIAVPQGTVSDFVAKEKVKHAKIIKYETNGEEFAAFLTGKVDIFLSDKSYVLLTTLAQREKFHIFKNDLLSYEVAVAFRKGDKELRENFNYFLQEWKKNGGFEKTYNKYFNSTAWKKLL